MKKLLLFLTFLPLSLLAQEPPIQQLNNAFNCSTEEPIIKSKGFRLSLTQANKQEIDIINYLLTTDTNTAYYFLRDYSVSGQTDAFSEENALKVVQYFKDEIIQVLDPQLTNRSPVNFIEYLRAYDSHAWYESDVSLTETYITVLIDLLGDLYSADVYWARSGQMNDIRWNTTLLMDIPQRRIETYHFLLEHLAKSDQEYIDFAEYQIKHLNAASAIIWRAYNNSDDDFILTTLEDTEFIDTIFDIISNPWIAENTPEVTGNFVNLFYPIILRSKDYSTSFDLDNFIERILDLEASFEVGTIAHAKIINALSYISRELNIDFNIDFDFYITEYYNLNFENEYIFDDNSMVIHTNLNANKVKSLYLAIRESRANFFKLTGDLEPLTSDTNEVVHMYIFESYETYTAYGDILFGIPTNNGGIYIEEHSSLYTFDRVDESLPLDILLKHEYVHYLDGRYNIEGDFGRTGFYDFSKSVFWVEGLANFVAGAHVDKGFYMTYAMASGIAGDIENNTQFSLFESINTSYSYGFKMYAHAEATWSYLYNYKRDTLQTMFDLVKSNNVNDLFNLLDEIAGDASLNTQYQEYLNQIKIDFEDSKINDPNLKYYDFTQPEIENDSISYALNQSGLSDFEILESFQNPYKFVKIQKDTVVTDLNEFDKYLESVITNLDKDLYNGFKIATAQIDSVDEDLNIIYSLEIPVNGKITVETEDNGEDNEGDGDSGEEGDNEGDGDPVDPVDPVDPEPIITKIVAYPNPTANIINITGLTQNSQVFIYNLNGQIVFNTTTSENVFSYNMSRFQTGMYIVVVKTQKETKSLKIIKR